MKRLAATAIALMMTAATGAAAAHPYGYGVQYASGPYGRGYYDYARVVNVVPIVAFVQQPVRAERCYGPARGWNNGYAYERGNNRTGGDLLGAVIGGALGNQVGKGDGRKAATIVGAVAGAAVADNIQRNDRDDRGNRDYGYGDRGYYNRGGCQAVTEYRPERRIVGYTVTYDYRGYVERVRTQFDPGNRIWVRVPA